MSLKQAATDLLKLADDIETAAAEVTQFVCDSCNHTATLAKINATRNDAAKTAGENVTVSEITVEDTISCPACEGVMAYKATDDSKGFYFDEKTADEEKPETDTIPHEETETTEEETQEHAVTEPGAKPKAEPKAKKPKEASIDYDQLDRYMRG